MDVPLAATLLHTLATLGTARATGGPLNTSSRDFTTWLILGASVVAVIYISMRPKKRKDPLAGSDTFRPSLAQQKALERDMQHVLVELSEMTRQMSAQLDTRAAKLELLIRDAEEKIQQLRDATLAHRPEATTDVSAAMALAAANAAPGTHRLNLRLVKDTVPPPPTEDRWIEIYRQADAGSTAGEIAAKMSRPRGEIELILALRPKNGSSPMTNATANENATVSQEA